jgi:hypothetical protein
MEVREEEMVREPLKPPQFRNAAPPIQVTEEGIIRAPVKPQL